MGKLGDRGRTPVRVNGVQCEYGGRVSEPREQQCEEIRSSTGRRGKALRRYCSVAGYGGVLLSENVFYQRSWPCLSSPLWSWLWRWKEGGGGIESETARKMGGKRKRAGGGGMEEEEAAVENSFEAERNATLEENRQRMRELGLLEDASALFATAPSPKAARLAKRKLAHSPADGSSRLAQSPLLPSGPVRRSSRLKGTITVSYKEQLQESSEEKPRRPNFWEHQKPEIYTDEDEKLLGSSEKPWELFVDGCDAKGARIYDSERGKTCHQCRQKTLGHRTTCSSCKALQGQFCGDCLFMRYGENVMETLKNEKWICPICRGICNCSLCRPKRGWPPTGSLYRKAIALGYASVAHYLILTRRAISIP